MHRGRGTFKMYSSTVERLQVDFLSVKIRRAERSLCININFSSFLINGKIIAILEGKVDH